MPYSAESPDPIFTLTRSGPAYLAVTPDGRTLRPEDILPDAAVAQAHRLTVAIVGAQTIRVFRPRTTGWIEIEPLEGAAPLWATLADPDGRARMLLLTPLGEIAVARPGPIAAHVLAKALTDNRMTATGVPMGTDEPIASSALVG